MPVSRSSQSALSSDVPTQTGQGEYGEGEYDDLIPLDPLPPSAPVIRASVEVPIAVAPEVFAACRIVTFDGLIDRREHLAVVFGDALEQAAPLVRLHSECLTGDVLGSARCDCGPQLREAIALLHAHGGVLLYLRQEGRDIGLYNKIDTYVLQDTGMDTFEANRALNFHDDEREYRFAGQMLLALGVREIEILSNNPEKARQLRDFGVLVRRQHRTGVHVTEQNRRYLVAKAEYGGHAIDIDTQGGI